MHPSSPPSLDAPCVGLLLWRPGSGGRELATLEVDGGLVLPKGFVEPGEHAHEAVTRLALGLAASRVDRVRLLPTNSDGPPRLSWWEARWAGVDPTLDRRPRVRWLPRCEAELALDHRAERELARGAARNPLERWSLARQERRARARSRDREGLAEQERRVAARADGPAGPGTPSWRAAALEHLGHAREALEERNAPRLRRARAAASRLELWGMDRLEHALAARELALRAETELAPAERQLVRAWVAPSGDGIHDPAALARAAELLDDARDRRASAAEARRTERVELASLAALVLLATWAFGSAAWTDRAATSLPSDLLLAVLLFGTLGGMASALLAPSSGGAHRGAPLVRAVAGAGAALVLFAIVHAGFANLPVTTAPGWLALSFAAGFAERAILRDRA